MEKCGRTSRSASARPFEGVVNQLKALGTLRNQAITSQTSPSSTRPRDAPEEQGGARRALKKALLEGKGNVKEIMEAEVALGKGPEELESIKGELKYTTNLIGLSTITLTSSRRTSACPSSTS